MPDTAALSVALSTKANGVETPINPKTIAEQVAFNNSTVAAELLALRAAVGGKTTTHVVPTIAARDALTGINAGDQAWVSDATGDSTVASGAAKYIWVGDSGTQGEEGYVAAHWSKTAEAESMDVVHDWALVQGKPEVLDKLTTDAGGNLLYDGKRIGDDKLDVAIINAGEDIPANLREGGLLITKQAK